MSVMEFLHVLVSVALLWGVMTLSPGPDFVLVSRTAILKGRRSALFCSAGMGLGCLIWGLFGAFGVTVLFALVPGLYFTLKLGGGLYLLYLGVKLVRASLESTAVREIRTLEKAGKETERPPLSHMLKGALKNPLSDWRLQEFARGLANNLSNPKCALFAASMFAASFPKHAPAILGVAAAALMGAVSLLWYVTLSHALAIPALAEKMRRAGHWIDRAAGGIFIALGCEFIFSK